LVIFFALVLGVGAWYLFTYRPKQEAIKKARLEQIAREEAEKQRKELEVQQKAAYDTLIIKADTAFNLENWDSARSRYTQASSLLPNEQYPRDQLALISTRLEETAASEAGKVAGVVETVSCTSGRFFVIVSSSIDGDLAKDYAARLAKEGKYVKIIVPNAANSLFHRVSIGDYDTREQARSATELNGAFGNEAWILKY